MLEQRLLTGEVEAAYGADLLRYTDLVAGYYVGDSASVVQAIADFSVWFFVWDDWHAVAARCRRDQAWCRLRVRLGEALDDPRGHRGHSDPLVSAFADAVARFFTRLGPAWNSRFSGHMRRIVDAYDQEYRNLTTGTVPTVAEFLELRRWTFGHDVWIDLLELTAGHELPRLVRHHDTYRRAAHASQQFASGYNDLCSMTKELAAGDIHNLGICLMRHEGLDQVRARARLRTHVADRVRRFLEAEGELSALLAAGEWSREVRATVTSCLFNMRNWISSVYWFHHESGRYRMRDWADPAWPPYVQGPDTR